MNYYLSIVFLSLTCLSACRQAKPAMGLQTMPRMVPDIGIPVRGTLGGGRMVDLVDGSRWTVQPAGQSATVHWRTGDPIQIARSGHPVYPFLLTHSPSGARALVRMGVR